jgi:hypothetical protein
MKHYKIFNKYQVLMKNVQFLEEEGLTVVIAAINEVP